MAEYSEVAPKVLEAVGKLAALASNVGDSTQAQRYAAAAKDVAEAYAWITSEGQPH